MATSVPEDCLTLSTAVRGYHVYKDIWSPTTGDEFVCKHEENNSHDAYAMGAYCNDKLVGHLPRELSRYIYFFLLHDGKISGNVTGRRQHCSQAGGMEIPCMLHLTGSKRIINRIKQLIKALNSSSITIV